ncbi:MAG: hypothetical protein ACOX8S_02025 [Christensenellales bacterium]
MLSWFDALPLLEKIFYYMALPATAIIVIQTVMLIFGGFGSDQSDLDAGSSDSFGDIDGDLDVDFDGDLGVDLDLDMAESGLDISGDIADTDLPESSDVNERTAGESGIKFVTVRGVITFFAITGWTGILFMEFKFPELISIIFALIFGAGAMVTVAYLVRALMRLDASGKRSYNAALGQVCDVYLTIPASGQGSGKVTMNLGGRFSEYDAITTCPRPIKTGEVARVVDIVKMNVMVVEPENGEAGEAIF